MKNTDLKASFLFYNDLNGSPLCLQNPIRRISANTFADVDKALQELDDCIKQKTYFLAGHIHYEVGYHFLKIPNSKFSHSSPLIDFYVFDNPINDDDESTQIRSQNYKNPSAFYNFSPPQERSIYDHRLARVQEHLVAGNAYQINYTFLNTCRSYGDLRSLFSSLYQTQRSRYAVCAELSDLSILSLSPELFFSKVANKITTRPMKGTLPLGVKDIPQDLADKLSAENLMIVDLLRNDLSKVAQPESVKVTQLMQTEEYATLQQIVSTIEGELDEDVEFSQIIKALFPCGSITGAPKKKTMEILQELEPEPRGLYTGTIGYINPIGDMQFNVAIRTLWGKNNWQYGVGGGIVLDSVDSEEYAEAVLKSQFIKTANSFSLFETMLAQEQKIADQEEHIARLHKSAEFFGFVWREEKIRQALREAALCKIKTKIRLQLFCNGDVSINSEPLAIFNGIKTVTFAKNTVDSKNIFYHHKTTERSLYDKEYTIAQTNGFYDVLFLNESGEVTEASRHNVFVRKGEDWFTAPIRCGLLPGVERDKYISTKNVKEKILYKSDILFADQVVLTNSVRGAVVVEVER